MSKKDSNFRFTSLLWPDEDLFVVGDVHGCISQLERLLNRRETQGFGHSKLIFVGDLVDRGDYSADVLNLVTEMVANGAVLIRGNHEEMMAQFLRNPKKYGRRWLRYGGLQTLRSFGITVDQNLTGESYYTELAKQLHSQMSDGAKALIENERLTYLSGNIFVSHAGADFSWPLAQQRDQSLLWGSEDMNYPRRDRHWVIHGHYVVDKPILEAGHVNVDTGAYASGTLTGAYISKLYLEFVTS